ncbi:GM11913 [Drosophila sechellia]|uniref:Sodium channel protein n=1 Tax=Drosophila sechellia TaxID=7238 RepID=B4IHA4_DROSE|nr:GM11913 [Drosophila sechellia]
MSDDQATSNDEKAVAKHQVVAYTQRSQVKHENRHIQLVREYGFHPRTKASVEDGDVLPRKFEPFPEHMYGKPLEEIDTFIYEETFCVVSKRFRKNYIHRFTGTKSLFLFYPWSPARRVCVYIATNQFFDYCVMATILFNCIFLAMTETVEEAEYIFLAIYSIEMVIKIIAKGFLLNKYTYLRNPWNWLDFVVITSGYATIGMEVGNLAGLRTFRVLRALKTVSIMPGLKTIINALLHSFRQLAEVMTLTIFCLMVFALFALQVYMGELRNKCVRQVPTDWTNVSHTDWQIWVNDTDNWLYDEDELPVLCGNLTGARHCPFEYVCLCVGENPNHGYTNFDNFMWSMLTTFQLITLDYWENVYNMVLATCGPMSVSFFTVVVFFGSFYLINLMLAVVALSYEEEAEITNEERKKDLLDHRDDSTFSFDPSVLNVKKLNKNNKKKIDSRKGVLLASYSKKKTSGVNRESSQDDSGVVDDHEEQDTTNDMGHVSTVELALSPREVRLIKCNGNIARIKNHNVYALHQEFSSEVVVIDDLPDRNCDRCVHWCTDYESWLQFQNCLYKVVRDPLFELAITLCIVLNTAFLAMEHHGMSESFRNALDVGNKVFTSIFTFECIVKLMALSKDFFLCGWNIFDLLIVTASLLDIIFELVDGLSVLRGLRLLRVLKLAQSWTTMKVLLSIIISTIGALGNLTLILVIVIYIFAVIGMQLFSKDYTPEKFDPDPVPRWNFNDFFHSFMMIFRILCGEWIEPLWDCMRAEEEQGASTCFAIFLPTLVMGNFMVLNLFLALLLNSFNSEELKSKKEEVGEESKLARSIERVRDLIRKKRQERKDRKERKFAEKFQQIVIDAQQAHAQTHSHQAAVGLERGDKPGVLAETKFHRLSYQPSAFTRLTEKPWHCLVSYVDDLTVGGRRNSQGAYNDPMTFPSYGATKAAKVPDDCFPQKCYDQWQGMRIVVNALMYAIPSIFNVLLVCLVFWLIFSIMGVQFFGGKFFKCVNEMGELLPITEVNDKWDCIEQNYTWINSKITFDHVGMGYLALLQVATFEGWMEVMADAVDARGVDLQPQREANLYAYIYFVIFIVCGSFFTLNLFIGVIIDNFNMLKKKYEGGVLEMFLTESQKHYYTAMKKLGRKKPQKVIKRPINHFLAMFYDLSNSRRFEIAIFVLIFLNMLTMGIEHYDQPHAVFFILEVSNAFFTTVFGLEAIVKIVGLRYHYFTVPWNMFDFLLVLASIFGILMEDIMIDLPISPTLLRVVRVFRIGRILRLIKAAKGIRKLLFALVVSLPALFNIGALLGLITFIYAILGMSLFGNVKLQGALDDMVNFQTFGRSMQLLFRLMTSAGWNDVLESLMIQPPDCDPFIHGHTNGNCGHPLLSITYFTSFIIISYMIVINMYIAIILENFNQAHQEEEIGIVEDDLEMFYIRWSKYDPHATQFIHFSQLSDFIASLDPPLGISKPNNVALVSFNLPISRGNKIHCLDILHALVKHVLGHVEETDNFKQLQEQMDVKFKKQFPTRKELEIVSSTRIWKRQEKAAKTIQTGWKEYLRYYNYHNSPIISL